MPPPASVPELLDRVRRSNIVAADRLEAFLVKLQAAGPTPALPAHMLDRLLDAGLITRFHADKLAAGKYKGFHLGSYLILDQLGAGGMGQVYLAEHTHMRRLVALKVLPPQAFENDAVARERFFREARAAGTLDHPNIVRVFDLCQEGKILYLVMEYVEGVSLQAVVGRFGPPPVAAACHYARQVAFGLQHASELGFVHRDIKPANLLLDREGVVKVLDFGLVRSESDAHSMLTRRLDSKSILGTADYVAPEQAVDSSRVDVRADLYSLGATLYYLLAGRPLFPEGRTAQKLVWQQIKDPVPVDRLRPEVPPELAAVVHRMLRKKPADRYQSPAEVFDALAAFVPDDVPPPDPDWMPETPARVAAAKAASPAPTAPRGSGSTSQILAAAMRSGSGVVRRPLPPAGAAAADTVREDGRLSITPPAGRKKADGSSTTHEVALDDTSPTPDPGPEELPPARRVNPKAVIAALAATLAVAVLVIVFLLMGR